MKRVNLLPPEAIKKGFWEWAIHSFLHSQQTRIAFVGIAIFFGVNVWQAGALFQSRNAVEAEKKKMAELQRQVKDSQKEMMQLTGEKEMVDKETKRLQSIMKAFEEVKKEVYPFAGMLKTIAEIVPEALWLTRLHLKQDVVTLTGAATDQATISAFMKRLDQSPDFENTGFNYTEKNTKSETAQILFQIVTQYVRHEN